MVATPAPKRKKGRSPSYPGVDLEQAIERARTLYQAERRNRVPVQTALHDWGYKSLTGVGAVVLAALKKFGLLEDEGSGDARHVRLTDLAMRILQDGRESSAERDAAIREAALTPSIHRQLWDEYGGELPSDDNLRFKLLRERAFTESGVADFIPEFRRTIAFANLNRSDKLPEQDQIERNEPRSSPGGRPVVVSQTGQAYTVQLPISPAEWARLEAPFPLTEAKWRQMLKVLDAMKPALVVDGLTHSDTPHDEVPEDDEAPE